MSERPTDRPTATHFYLAKPEALISSRFLSGSNRDGNRELLIGALASLARSLGQLADRQGLIAVVQ